MRLTIAPLATPGNMGEAAKNAVLTAKKLYIQTYLHPSANWIKEQNLAAYAMDGLYGECYDFDELNEAIAKKLFEGDEDAVYAPIGRGVSLELMQKIKATAKAKGAKVVVLAGSGYAEAAAAICTANTQHTFDVGTARILSANMLPCGIDTATPLCVEEIDTPIRAGEVKLGLSEYYPDEYGVIFCTMDENGDYSAREIPLFELDRQKSYFAATTLLIPPIRFESLERYGMDGLEKVVERLRAPGGCPWDREQTHESIRSSMVEESYEVLDAIDSGDMDALCEELGDVLLQVALHTQMEVEAGSFNLRDVTTGIVQKLIYRHPHVFASVKVKDSDEVLKNWEDLKKKEKHQQTTADAMRAVPKGFPALLRAYKVQKKAAHIGFDVDGAIDAIEMLEEKANALGELININGDRAKLEQAVGEVLFAGVAAARLLKIEPELVLKDVTDGFLHKFADMESAAIESGKDISTLAQLQSAPLYNRAKKA